MQGEVVAGHCTIPCPCSKMGSWCVWTLTSKHHILLKNSSQSPAEQKPCPKTSYIMSWYGLIDNLYFLKSYTLIYNVRDIYVKLYYHPELEPQLLFWWGKSTQLSGTSTLDHAMRVFDWQETECDGGWSVVLHVILWLDYYSMGILTFLIHFQL